MKYRSLAVTAATVIAIGFGIAGCSTTSSSTVANATSAPRWSGPILVSPSELPAGTQYKVIGTVQADARSGYDEAKALYPVLAEEARKIGANAVVGVVGRRKVTAFSWSAAYVSGTAVRVENVDKLKGMPGSRH
jgi:hypothetical protein